MIQEIFDVPCINGLTLSDQQIDEEQQDLENMAELWLKARADALGATLIKRTNEHDFGQYPSFELEVDNQVFDFHDMDMCEKCANGEECEIKNQEEQLWATINQIHEDYFREFEEFF